MNEWQSADHVSAYLERAGRLPHRSAGEQALLDEIPTALGRVLDLGSGDGRLLDLVLQARPQATGVALDFSPAMLRQLLGRFASTPRVAIVDHNLDHPLPDLGAFDAVVSSFAIHHLPHERKRQLYEEVWALLQPGGVFCNLEHVASASPYGHDRFLEALGITAEEEDPSNKLLDVRTQLEWLREIGFSDVDCYWKWRELALLVGRRGFRGDIRVFVQNEAGSKRKHHHDEKTLVWKRVAEVSRPYPFPYGFIVGTTGADGGNVDCFVISRKPLRTGELVDCRIAGLMEQFEDGQDDHNVLAVLRGTGTEIDHDVQQRLTAFVQAVFEHKPEKRVEVGRFLSADDAEAYVRRHLDARSSASGHRTP
jgi:inorganic pyrophosphatase/ubiquinone/menaquinone biosynthesis C-methylase UbiE